MQPEKVSSKPRCECSALVRRDRQERCGNGFPVNAGCVGIEGAVPWCLNERLCGRAWPETGKPDRCEVFNV